jgi:hypothetical protein
MQINNSYGSVTGCMGDTQFHFRIRQCPGRKTAVKLPSSYNRDCPVTLQVCIFYVLHFPPPHPFSLTITRTSINAMKFSDYMVHKMTLSEKLLLLLYQCINTWPVNCNCWFCFQSETAFYYGFVYFRQTKDRSIRRGYFQKVNVLACSYCTSELTRERDRVQERKRGRERETNFECLF